MKRILINALAALLSLSALSYSSNDNKDPEDSLSAVSALYGAEDNKDSKDSKNEKTTEKPKRSKLALAAKAVKYIGAAAAFLEDELADEIDPKYLTAAKKAGAFVDEVTDRKGNLDYDKLVKTFATKSARKKAVVTFLGKLGISEADISKYVDLKKAVTALTIDVNSEEIVSLDKEQLLRAINNGPLSEKVAKLLKVPTQVIREQLDAAKHILGEPVIPEKEAFNDELLNQALKNIIKYNWQLGALNGAQTVARSPKVDELNKKIQQSSNYLGLLTGYTRASYALSACGTYMIWSNPYTAAGYTALAGAATLWGWTYKEKPKVEAQISSQKKQIDDHIQALTIHKRSNFKSQTKSLEDAIKEQEQLIANQMAVQRKYIENQVQMHSVQSWAVRTGVAAATNLLIDDETMENFLKKMNGGAATATAANNTAAAGSAEEPSVDPQLQTLMQSEYAQEMSKFVRGLKNNPKAVALLGDEEKLAQAFLVPFILFGEEAFIEALTKAEKKNFLTALITYVMHFFKAEQILKFSKEIAQFKIQPMSILQVVPLLTTMSNQQLHALHGILKLSNAPQVPNFDAFMQKITPAQMQTLANPSLLLIAAFNPEVLLGEQAFIKSISSDEGAQKAFAALLNNK